MSLTYLRSGETLILDRAACTGCGVCLDVCPHGVFTMERDGARIERRGHCMECGACALNCRAGAIRVRSGVGCAAAVLSGLVRCSKPGCGGDATRGKSRRSAV